MQFLGYTHYLVRPIIHRHYTDPNKGMFSNLWNAEKNYAIGVCKAAFSPKTAPLFSTLSMIQVVSMLAMFALSSGEGQERTGSSRNLAEVSIPQNNHLQTGWGMSTSPTRILADFVDNATSYYQKW